MSYSESMPSLPKQSIHDLCKLGDDEALSEFLCSLEDTTSALSHYNDEGMLPLHVALASARSGCVITLLKAGADPCVPFEGLMPIHLSLALGQFKFYHQSCFRSLQALLEHPDVSVNARDRLGRTALHIAAISGLSDAITLLISKSIDANLRDFSGRMAIHCAIEHKNEICLQQMLQELGSDMLLCADGNGDTPIHLAVRRGAWKCVPVLINLGSEAILSINNEHEQTPQDVANICGFAHEFQKAINGVIPPPHTQGKCTVITHENCKDHASLSVRDKEIIAKQKKYQAENPYRIEILYLDSFGSLLIDEFADNINWIKNPPLVNIADILRVHEYSYYYQLEKFIKELEPNSGPVKFDRDTIVSDKSLDAALAAAGTVTHAVDLVVSGKSKNAFCSIRPPGHHLGPSGAVDTDGEPDLTSAGFCLLNNVAIGAAYAIYNYRGNINKVAIVDFDVHHGNGTEAIVKNLKPSKNVNFIDLNSIGIKANITSRSYKPWLNTEDSKNVLFISSHGYGEDFGGKFYPYSGTYCGPEEDYPAGILNLPLPYGTESSSFRQNYREKVFPRLLEFQPDLIMISAGFDGHGLDSINHGFMDLDEDDFTWITENLIKIANTCCQGRIVSVLEGGYRIKGGIVSALAQSVAAHVMALMNATNEYYTQPDMLSVERDAQKMELKRKIKEENVGMRLRRRKIVNKEDSLDMEENEDESGMESDEENEEEEDGEDGEIEEGDEEKSGDHAEEAATEETEINHENSTTDEHKVIGI